MAADHSGSVPVGAIIVGLRPGDQRELDRIAERVGRPAKEVAGILLEEAIRREAAARKPAVTLVVRTGVAP